MGGSNSKADLADILVALAQNDVSPDAHDFWDELWKLDTTAEDVFELITPEDVRHLRRERPENVVTLFTQATAQLCQIVHTPVPMYFGQALNCAISASRFCGAFTSVWSPRENGFSFDFEADAPRRRPGLDENIAFFTRRT